MSCLMRLGRGESPHYNDSRIKLRAVLRSEVGMDRGEAAGHQSSPVVISATVASKAPGSVPAPASPAAKRPVLSATAQEWRSWMVERRNPTYRAQQVLGWVIRRRA